jgi:hypothetical protein
MSLFSIYSRICLVINFLGCTKASIGYAESSSRLSKKSSSHLFSSLVRHCLATYPNVAAEMIYTSKEAETEESSAIPESSARSGACSQHNNARNCAVDDLLSMPYAWWKKVNPAYSSLRGSFLSEGPFALWLCDDPLLNEQFSIEIAMNDVPVKKAFSGQKSFAIISGHDSSNDSIADLAKNRNREDFDEMCFINVKKSRHD